MAVHVLMICVITKEATVYVGDRPGVKYSPKLFLSGNQKILKPRETHIYLDIMLLLHVQLKKRTESYAKMSKASALKAFKLHIVDLCSDHT